MQIESFMNKRYYAYTSAKVIGISYTALKDPQDFLEAWNMALMVYLLTEIFELVFLIRLHFLPDRRRLAQYKRPITVCWLTYERQALSSIRIISLLVVLIDFYRFVDSRDQVQHLVVPILGILGGFKIVLLVLKAVLKTVQRVESGENYDFAKPVQTAEGVCPICLDDLAKSLAELKCHHVFHLNCIKGWFALKATCPQCRAG